jgi:cell shape-determining protein MreC
MDRKKIVAIITGVISLILAITYLILVSFLDWRGEMLPAPQSYHQSHHIHTQLGLIHPKITDQIHP